MTDLVARIAAAIERRRALLEGDITDACRLIHGAADGLPGLVVERFAEVWIAQLHEGRLESTQADLRAALAQAAERHDVRAVYRKWFVRDRSSAAPEQVREHSDPQPWIGRPVEPELTIREHGLKFAIRPYDGFSVGLFLEQRENRRRVAELARGRRVLNTFCYTCGFSIAAAQGGAQEVASVDSSKRYLEWGRQNFALNGLDVAPHRFYCSDVRDFHDRARRQGRQYDLVILDPPSFSRSKRPPRVFTLVDQLDDLVSGAAGLLAPAGVLLLSTNHRDIDSGRLERAVQRAAEGRHCGIIARPALPPDFARDPAYSCAILAEFGERPAERRPSAGPKPPKPDRPPGHRGRRPGPARRRRKPA